MKTAEEYRIMILDKAEPIIDFSLPAVEFGTKVIELGDFIEQKFTEHNSEIIKEIDGMIEEIKAKDWAITQNGKSQEAKVSAVHALFRMTELQDELKNRISNEKL